MTPPRGRAEESAAHLLRLVGEEIWIPLVNGDSVRHVNLDYAASAPAMVDVVEGILEFLPWYSSVHRGTGFKSQIASAAYDRARLSVARFLDARQDDTVIFTRNTTDSINLLAESLPSGTMVAAFASEHHANLLPWRRPHLELRHIPLTSTPGAAVEALESLLRNESRVGLVAVSGASNVTGEIWPIAEIVAAAHRRGARVFVDAAQLAPHHPISMRDSDVDYLAFSGHKLYAPFGSGVLVGRSDWLCGQAPFLRGGGAVDLVTLTDVIWTELPDRQEAGSPNVVGAVAIALACESLMRVGMERLAEEEQRLAAYARDRLARVPGLELYRLWPADAQKLGIVAFNLEGFHHSLLAAILSAEYGISVRHGCFCAHPLVTHLLDVNEEETEQLRRDIHLGRKDRMPGAVRASIGLASSVEDIEALATALTQVGESGHRWTYLMDVHSGDYLPEPDPRPYPHLRTGLATPMS